MRKQELDVDPLDEMPPVRCAQVKYVVLERDSEEKHMTQGPAAIEMAWLEPFEHRVLGKQPYTFRRNGVTVTVSVFTQEKNNKTHGGRVLEKGHSVQWFSHSAFVTQYTASSQ